jgi:hypothetical protein
MRARRIGLAIFLAVAGWLACQPGQALAHPNLAGQWVTLVPPGGSMVLDFTCGKYMGNGVWRGHFVFTVSGVPTGSGEYELRLYTGTQGTLGLIDPLSAPGWTVGNLNLDLPTVTYLSTTFKRQGVPLPPIADKLPVIPPVP